MADDLNKQCTLCKQLLPTSSFYPSPKRKDGLYPWCRSCSVAKSRIYNESKPGWKEFKRAYDRERTQRLKDKLSVANRERYLRNRAERLAQAKAYALANPDQVKSTKQAYKHRRKTVEREGMGGGEFNAWKQAQKKVCHWCGLKVPSGFVVDHIQPLAKGGKHEAHNLAISCRSCNASKAARDPIAFAQSRGKLL